MQIKTYFAGAGGGGFARGGRRRGRAGRPPLAGVRGGGGERRGRHGVRRCPHLGQTCAHRRAMPAGRVNQLIFNFQELWNFCCDLSMKYFYLNCTALLFWFDIILSGCNQINFAWC